MIRFLLDENFNGKIVRGLRARQPDVDMIRVQNTELSDADDPTVLEWAAKEGRILLTHDLDTMTRQRMDCPGAAAGRRDLRPGYAPSCQSD
ncbi:DUF5615 family PIN-like protein [Kamptonema cortianum]|nr:DUF5615 family PIN-like protein [Oscillatoria laete-virens]MDK3157340.1 DUF5615 family PIN-like protein [Kamptonema cortianum]MDL5054904.1 DUF5615 family PIN-like protein [Oscillatoria laete-virens NRMC-F 0139]